MIVSIALLLVFTWFTLTDGDSAIAERPPPTAAEVGAGRNAANQLRASRTDPLGQSGIDLGQAELDGIAAMASHGFRPDRLAVQLHDGTVSVRGSHRLPGDRWLNAGLDIIGGDHGFPLVQVHIGPLTLSPFLSRFVIQSGRLLLRLRKIDLPPLDDMVRDVAIGRDRVRATISLPNRTGLVDGVAGIAVPSADARVTVDLYCRLATLQLAAPATTLSDLLHRAFTSSQGSLPSEEYNRAAFVALAMLVVDQRAGDLAGTARVDSDHCRIPPFSIVLHGRADWAKHWALSAALAAGAGSQLSEAMGEWKELADSLSMQSKFALGDPTGFSFADLSADRSGFRTARSATDRIHTRCVAEWLRTVTAEQLLPRQLTTQEDGITNAEFVRRYGSLSDPRFTARVTRIDRALGQPCRAND